MRDHVDLINRIADMTCTLVLVSAVFYFAGHAITAWVNGAFQAVTR